jgi:uncharacterized protein YeaO (DUF488 family)
MSVAIKRVYEPAKSGEYRILVDRLWPRGLSKEEAAIDVWMKDVAPSAALRTWFDHKPERFNEFRKRYLAELADNPAIHQLRALVREHKNAVLLYGARDLHMNQAVVLQEYMKG